MLSFDLFSLAEFSRDRCVSICTFLVPANLAIVLLTLFLAAKNRPALQIRLSVAIGVCLATIMILHVMTWLAIGVITPVTFILTGLAIICLIVNLWTIRYQSTFRRWLQIGRHYLSYQ
jgi:prepilin signal peptidase PulO-like enzyme (type II secretory pathway)